MTSNGCFYELYTENVKVKKLVYIGFAMDALSDLYLGQQYC